MVLSSWGKGGGRALRESVLAENRSKRESVCCPKRSVNISYNKALQSSNKVIYYLVKYMTIVKKNKTLSIYIYPYIHIFQ